MTWPKADRCKENRRTRSRGGLQWVGRQPNHASCLLRCRRHEVTRSKPALHEMAKAPRQRGCSLLHKSNLPSSQFMQRPYTLAIEAPDRSQKHDEANRIHRHQQKNYGRRYKVGDRGRLQGSPDGEPERTPHPDEECRGRPNHHPAHPSAHAHDAPGARSENQVGDDVREQAQQYPCTRRKIVCEVSSAFPANVSKDRRRDRYIVERQHAVADGRSSGPALQHPVYGKSICGKRARSTCLVRRYAVCLFDTHDIVPTQNSRHASTLRSERNSSRFAPLQVAP